MVSALPREAASRGRLPAVMYRHDQGAFSGFGLSKAREMKARFQVRPLPGFLRKNGKRIRTQLGPLTPKPPSFFSEEAWVSGRELI